MNSRSCTPQLCDSSFWKLRWRLRWRLRLVVAAVLLMSGPVLFQQARSQSTANDTFTLNLNNADIHSLIETVSLQTGRNFIVDPRVRATVTVITSEPINGESLYELFLSVLEVHGYSAMPAGNFIKIVPLATGIQSAVPVLKE